MAKPFDSTDVVRLPTAAPRQVKQPCNKAGRASRRAFREASPWPREYICPGRRAALRQAEELFGVEQTPALALALAIVAELNEEARLRVIGRVAAGGSTAARQAIALVRAETTTFGEKWDLLWAMERLQGADQ